MWLLRQDYRHIWPFTEPVLAEFLEPSGPERAAKVGKSAHPTLRATGVGGRESANRVDEVDKPFGDFGQS
jgi:hypothetical protein